MYRKILVPLDGSPLAEAVLPHAQALAKSENAEIVILQVPLTPNKRFLSRDATTAAILADEIELESEVYVKTEVAKLKGEGSKVSGITRDGPVPDTILAVAEETHADVIAMSTHARTGLQRWILGSVTDKVIHHSHIPVVVIHPN